MGRVDARRLPPSLRAVASRAGTAPVATALAVVALLGQMAFAMLTAAREQTPAFDEPAYVAAATAYLRTHDLGYNAEHPPLGKLIVAAGLVVAGPRLPPVRAGDDQWTVARNLLYFSGQDPWRLMWWARLPMILLTLAFGLVAYLFARDLAGRAGGLVALVLYATNPDLIAHGSLAGLDVPMAGFLVTTSWLLWRARDRPRRYLPLAGLALGAAVATKMNALAAVPVTMVLVVWVLRPRWRHGVLAALGVAATAVAVVWVCYLAVDPRLRWAPLPGVVPEVGGVRGLVTSLLPFPEPFRAGLRTQLGLEGLTYPGFLYGEFYRGSRWYYLPAAVLVKYPIALLVLGVAGLLRCRAALPYLLTTPVVLFALAMAGARDFGVRYVIFLPMVLAVAAGAVTLLRRRWVPWATAALVLFAAVSSVRTFPYYLPYSNEAFGGPAATHRWLHDSNVDWGQDLGRLADRLRRDHPGEPVWLVYQGTGVPSSYGIAARDPRSVDPGQVRGLLVVSDSWVAKAPGDPPLQALIESSTPIGEVGHSITIYRR